MNQDRIHAYLDGELPLEALSDAERARLEGMQAATDAVAATLRAAPLPDLTERVMAALPAAPAPRTAPTPGAGARLAAWLWRPRRISLSFRPAYALGGVAAALAGALLLPQLPPEAAPGAPAVAVREGASAEARLYVQFRLEAPEASQVELAGSFTQWEPSYELRQVAPGVWTALVPLEPGVHDYTFVIDGEQMVVDPYAAQVEDAFGGSNSRLFLPPPNGSA